MALGLCCSTLLFITAGYYECTGLVIILPYDYHHLIFDSAGTCNTYTARHMHILLKCGRLKTVLSLERAPSDPLVTSFVHYHESQCSGLPLLRLFLTHFVRYVIRLPPCSRHHRG